MSWVVHHWLLYTLRGDEGKERVDAVVRGHGRTFRKDFAHTSGRRVLYGPAGRGSVLDACRATAARYPGSWFRLYVSAYARAVVHPSGTTAAGGGVIPIRSNSISTAFSQVGIGSSSPPRFAYFGSCESEREGRRAVYRSNSIRRWIALARRVIASRGQGRAGGRFVSAYRCRVIKIGSTVCTLLVGFCCRWRKCQKKSI